MCVLCSEAIMQIHWTDRKMDCIGKGSTAEIRENQRSRQRDRQHRVRLLNKILCYYGLTIEDWNGSKYILRDKKGRSEIIQDLGALWAAAQNLICRPLDPLDPKLIRNLTSDRTERG